MTTVGAIAGLGMASGELNWPLLREIVVWWIVVPIVGFGIAAIIGRYVYPQLESWIAIHHSDEQLIELDRSRYFPRPTITSTTSNELFCSGLVLITSCLMAFSSGTSNIANVIAPLVGSGAITMNAGIVLGSGAVAVGAFTIARRTIETLSNEISALPLAAAVVIAPVSAALVIVLAALDIPVSFVIITTMGIAGIGWGRAIRRGKSVLPRTDTLVEADVECFRRRTSVGTETP